MFEEGQLYAPVTAENGTVTVHLDADHPGFADPAYRERRNLIAAEAIEWTPERAIPEVPYTEEEHGVWRLVSSKLAEKHERLACRRYREAMSALSLPTDHVPQLTEVGACLQPLTGFVYHPAPGLVPFDTFYGSLADGVFHSTQYLRHHGKPLYTPEPDLIHEVIGHGGLLADPVFADLNRRAGQAARRVTTPEAKDFFARVFWFSIEFGVLREDGELRAYGAGLLSSYGEIDEFRGADLRSLDIAAMGVQTYDISHYQPILFAAGSIEEIETVVGGFFDACSDEYVTATYLTSRV